jgi:hypothetical protein
VNLVSDQEVQMYERTKRRRQDVQERGPSKNVVECFDGILQGEQVVFGLFGNFQNVLDGGAL